MNCELHEAHAAIGVASPMPASLRIWKDMSQKSSKDRRNLGSGSTGDPEPRKLVLSAWTSLLNKQAESTRDLSPFIKQQLTWTVQGECARCVSHNMGTTKY